MNKEYIQFYKENGVTELNIPIKEGFIKVIVLKEQCDNYEVKGVFKETALIQDKIDAFNIAVRYIGNTNPNYQTIYIRTADQGMKDAALLAGFSFDMQATDKASEEADLSVYTIHNKEYKKEHTQKVL